MRQARCFALQVVLTSFALFSARVLRGMSRQDLTEPAQYTALWGELAIDTITQEVDRYTGESVRSRSFPLLNTSTAHYYEAARPPCSLQHAADRCEILRAAVGQLRYATERPRGRLGAKAGYVLSAVWEDGRRPLYSEAAFRSSALARPWLRCC